MSKDSGVVFGPVDTIGELLEAISIFDEDCPLRNSVVVKYELFEGEAYIRIEEEQYDVTFNAIDKS